MLFSMIFIVMLIMLVGKIIGLAFKAAWGLTKIVLWIILFPVLLIGLFLAGVVYIAFPLLLVAWIVSVLCSSEKIL